MQGGQQNFPMDQDAAFNNHGRSEKKPVAQICENVSCQ